MEKIKVLWLSDFNCATGFAQVAHNLLEQLGKTGKYDIDVVGINHYGKPYDSEVWPVKAWPAMDVLRSRDPRYADMYGRQQVLDFLGTGKYDLFFSVQDTFIMESIAKQVVQTKKELLKGKMKPFSWIFYYPVDGNVKENWVQDAVALADYPVAYTEFGKKETHRYAPTLNVDVVPHGIDPKVFFPISAEERKTFRDKFFAGAIGNKFLVTNVNRNQRRKDIPRTLAAFAEFHKQRPDSILYLHMKHDDLGGNILEMARHFNLQPFRDFIVPDNFSENVGYPLDVVNKIYNASDAVISTTLGEGWGLSSVEAMATKTPVIFPRHTSLVEILDDGKRGRLVDASKEWVCLGAEDMNQIRPVTSVDSMVEGLLDVYDHREKYKEIAEVAYQWVQTLAWEKISKKWDQIFQRAYNHLKSPIITDVGRNEMCPECLKAGQNLKWKKCTKHNINITFTGGR